MNYYTDLFSPETFDAFNMSSQKISGFRKRQQNIASRIEVGDRFICYVTKLSRWVGILEVTSTYFEDNMPIFQEEDDPFVIRFNVEPLVWFPKEKAIPIHEDFVWNTLSFTRNYDKNTSNWTGKLRNSLNKIDDRDAAFLEEILFSQLTDDKTYEIDDAEYKRLLKHKVRRSDKEITVSVPIESRDENEIIIQTDVRESTKIQSLLTKIGNQMGFRIWIPKNDRNRVLEEYGSDAPSLLETLPLNYDNTTLKTIENIDVLWLKGRAIMRAFEVEHTTSIYSGILRMADLLALQPNMNIRLHIVAPDSRRDKVFQEIQRPVFSLLEVAALSERCTYLSYDSINEIADLQHLSHLSDSVLDEYTEEAE
jgi:predicted RNA-binding protein